ncbi:GntR family transcriptional regulator [Corynebacterium glyciniphilum]|uniref:GntR family transcriptional regulator n=1 Tax=Corynebacterium glyciniphilum TaxID=1404244 RepID=UPI0011AB2D85|nr:GntR family transcriptional regulator [Corynebacterium glyciniphilum]
MDTEGKTSELKTTIEEEILLGRLFPRERLVEDELMERFNAKRHIVRSTLDQLASEGMVEKRKNVGALVRSYSEKDVVELYELRDLLETSAVGKINFPVSTEELASLEQAQQKHDNAIEARNVLAVIRANAEFHDKIFALQDNVTLSKAIERYSGMTYVIRSAAFSSQSSLRRSQTEHHAMIEAIKNADHKKLVDICRQHLLPSRDAYLERLHISGQR